MPIDTDQAAEVARRHRLTLMDAHALAELADDTDHAERIAAEFATPQPDPDTAMRQAIAEHPERRHAIIRDSIAAKRRRMPAVDHNGIPVRQEGQ